MSFTPLDSTFLHSTVVAEGPDVVAVWCLFLASKDKLHVSDLTASAIARLLGVEVERIDKAIEVLTSPDKRSRNKEFEGRRLIAQEDGSWLVVSGEKYQKLASAANAVARNAKYVKNKTAREKSLNPEEFICEGYGCSRAASVEFNGRRLCSAHAIEAE